MVVFILSAADPRMTIDHSGGPERQDNSGREMSEAAGGFA
jgi:hypothetical protein